MRIHLSETTLTAIADAIASTVVIRKYTGGTSVDIRQTPTKAQRSAIHAAALGSLLGLDWGEDTRNNKGGGREDAIINTAEFFLLCTSDDINGYDTIYNPLKAVTEVWRLASEAGKRNGTLTDWCARLVWSLFPDWRDLFDGVMAYAQPEEWFMLGNLAEAETTMEAWQRDGITDGLPAPDVGLLFLLWNLYVSDHQKALADANRM